MSHHFDSPTAIEDGRINLCDVYVFPGRPGSTVLLLTVNPDAGRSTPTAFRSEAVYEFVAAPRGRDVEDLAVRVRFAEPDASGSQTYTVLLADGQASYGGTDGRPLVSGTTGSVSDGDDGVRAWAGVAGDPFWGNGFGLAQFHQALANGEYRADLFQGEQGNVFAGRNVSAVAIEVPDSLLGDGALSLWARISLVGHAPQRWVSRMGQPMLRPLFFPVPGEDSEILNAGSPRTDVDAYRDRLAHAARTVARVSGNADQDLHAKAVVDAFLPDVLQYRAGEPARFVPGGGNGRGLHDDAFSIALSAVAGADLGATRGPHPVNPEFPHLAAPDREERPALAELFGLRQQRDTNDLPNEAGSQT